MISKSGLRGFLIKLERKGTVGLRAQPRCFNAKGPAEIVLDLIDYMTGEAKMLQIILLLSREGPQSSRY